MERKESKNMKINYLILIVSILCLGIFVYKMMNSSEKVNLSDEEIKRLNYFEEVALNSEFGDSPKRVLKWNKKMLVYIQKDKEYLEQVEKIKQVLDNIKQLTSGNLLIEVTNDISISNSIIYLGNKEDLLSKHPDSFQGVDKDFTGLVDIEFDLNKCFITSNKIFISTDEPLDIQFSSILEEITQGIGLPADSKSYSNSVFYENQIADDKINFNYSKLDIEMIKLLYHPKIKAGLNVFQVRNIYKRILKSEPDYFSDTLKS